MKRSTEHHSIRPPRQQRSRETQERLLAATERLLEDSLWDDLSIQRIADEAGMSIGAFYARFPSKDAMLPMLVRRYIDTLANSALELYAMTPPEAGLHERVSAIVIERVNRYRRWRGLLRALVVLGRVRPEAIKSEIGVHAATVGRAIIDFMRPVFDEIHHPDPEVAVRRGFYFVSAICRERVLFDDLPHASSTPMSDDELLHELTVLFLGYLRADRSSSGP